MWYAIQILTGAEKNTIQMCRILLDTDVLKQIYSPEIEVMKRYRGSWHRLNKPLFPGYLFMETEDVNKLFLMLKQIPKLTKVLGTDMDFVPLQEAEVEMLDRLLDQEKVLRLSSGIVVGDQLEITAGPLMGMEGMVKKIDRHKRIAILEVPMFGRVVETTVGLEIVVKG